MRAKPSNENRMAVGIIANLEAPGMAIDRHVEFALSGIDSGANKRRLFHLPRPCLVKANLMFRQPYGSGEELKAILLSHSPPGYGGGDPTFGVRSGRHPDRTFFTEQANSTGNR